MESEVKKDILASQEKASTFKDRCEDQAKGVVADISPESKEFFKDLARRLGIPESADEEEK